MKRIVETMTLETALFGASNEIDLCEIPERNQTWRDYAERVNELLARDGYTVIHVKEVAPPCPRLHMDLGSMALIFVSGTLFGIVLTGVVTAVADRLS